MCSCGARTRGRRVQKWQLFRPDETTPISLSAAVFVIAAAVMAAGGEGGWLPPERILWASPRRRRSHRCSLVYRTQRSPTHHRHLSLRRLPIRLRGVPMSAFPDLSW